MKKKQGFTLIELVVVMAIIAVLAALMVAALSAARKQATNTQRTGDAKTLEVALESYSAVNGGKYPSAGTACSPACDVVNGAVGSGTALQNFLKTKGMLSASLSNLDKTVYFTNGWSGKYTLFACDTATTAIDTGKLPTPGDITSGLGEACTGGSENLCYS